MKSKSHQRYACVTATLAILGMVTLGAQAAPPDGYHYAYFKETVALRLDTSRVAVFGQTDASPIDLSAAIDPEDQVEALPIMGAFIATVGQADRSIRGIRERIRQLKTFTAVAHTSPVFLDDHGEPVIISNHVLVGFDPAMTKTASRVILDRQVSDGDVIEPWPAMAHAYRIRTASRDGFSVLEFANRLAELTEVQFAQPDMLTVSRGMEIPNDPLFADQWGLHNTGQSGGTVDMDMDVPETREFTSGDPSIVIAILDNGMQLDHPDLGALTGVDFTGNGTAGAPGNECDNHATLLAGTIRGIANNSIGIAGVAPGCTLVSVKYGVSTVPCNGNGTYMTSWLVDAINWCANNGVHVTNNSNALNVQAAVTTAYQNAYNAGVVHFASSGNFSSPIVSYPANLATVIAVGGIDRNGARAWFSNYGNGMALVAPGIDIATTDRSGSDGQDAGDYDTTEGTSFSSPYAAGVAGLVLSVDPTLTPAEVESILRTTALDLGPNGYDVEFGDGLVQAQAAVEAAGARLPSTTFADCLGGPLVSTPPIPCSSIQFDLCDFDDDADVDLRDFSHYTN